MREWLEGRADEMAELLEALVAVDTSNPPGRGRERCAQLLAEAMEALGLAPEVAPWGVRGSVGEGPLVYFHGHFDVVPAQAAEQFTPRRANGVIHGRGTADMKGGLVSMLYGAAAARGCRIVLHFVCDEETGSTAGSGHLREAGLIDPAAVAMLTAEPTGGVVWNASRGAITLRATVRGREAHVGQLELGENAFERMLRLAAPLAELSHELLARDSMLLVGGAAGAGANFNVVPGSAWFSVDRRLNPDEDLDAELARLTGLLDGAEVEVLQAQPAAVTDPSHPAALELARCVAEVEGAPPRFELCPGVLETRWYAQLGIPAFAYGAGRLDVSHGPDEYIDEAAMRRCAEVYARFATRTRTPPTSP